MIECEDEYLEMGSAANCVPIVLPTSMDDDCARCMTNMVALLEQKEATERFLPLSGVPGQAL